ncbi:MAG: protein kinase [Polyangiales bacterium]
MGAEKFTESFRFDRYEIGSLLGEGGMGSVWKATHLKLQKPVVIKTLRPEHARSDTTRARFVREGEAASRIRHPNVVEIFDVAEFEGSPYLVMEFLEGEDLRALLRRRGVLSLDAIVDVMLPVCNAVAAAHDAGVVHRDLKPENIFLSRTRDGALVPKVLDFGISRIDDGALSNQTTTGALLGTPRYMSPEQARGERGIDARSDQYALGVILYECATGRVPVDEGALYEVLRRTIHGEFAPPRAHRPELPADFEAVILRALSLAPASRFPSVRALAAALLPFGDDIAKVRHSPSLAPRFDTLPGAQGTLGGAQPNATLGDTGVEVDTQPDARRTSRLVIASLAALSCIAAAGAWAHYYRAPSPQPQAATRAQEPAHATPITPVAPRVEAPPVEAPHVEAPPAVAIAPDASTAAPPAIGAHAAHTRVPTARTPTPRAPTTARTTHGTAPAAPRTTSGLSID